jgi:diacylglycerol kinase family enzyme
LSSAPARGAGAPAAGDTCLLINPLATRTLYGSLAARARAMAEMVGIEVAVISDPRQITSLLQRLHARRLKQLFVLSGDGTAQMIAAYLENLPPGEWTPNLLLLGGGRANVVPRAHGGDPALPALRAALDAMREGRALRVEAQPLLRIEQDGRPAHHGFVVAGAIVDFGIRRCREYRASGDSRWHRGLAADRWCVFKLLLQAAIGRSPAPPSPQLDITLDSGERMLSRVRVLMATSLRDADGHYNPYAERGSGPLRVTAVAEDARRFWRNLPKALAGKFDDNMSTLQGYLSGRCHAIEIRGLAGCSLDGEPVDTDPALPVRVKTGMSLNILQPFAPAA